jgi:hypothetical protein
MGDDSEEADNCPAVLNGELVRKPPVRSADGGTLAPGGGSLNPGGRSKAERDVVALARQRGPEIIKRLFYIAMRGDIQQSATVRACELLLERGFGKAPIVITDENGNPTGNVFIVAMPAPRMNDDDEGDDDGE